jgi:serine/threonine protein kinase
MSRRIPSWLRRYVLRVLLSGFLPVPRPPSYPLCPCLTWCANAHWARGQIVLIDAKPSVRKQILRELQIMHDCHSEYIISFFGAFLSDPNICICMEFMDKGSLDGIYKRIGPIDIEVVAKVAHAVLEGLTYLYDAHRIIHRGTSTRFLETTIDELSHLPSDIKPSNILCNSKGQIKICDFGVSGELINSIADTFVGTSTYMSVRVVTVSLPTLMILKLERDL